MLETLLYLLKKGETYILKYLWGFSGFKATSVEPDIAKWWGKLVTEDDLVLPEAIYKSVSDLWVMGTPLDGLLQRLAGSFPF